MGNLRYKPIIENMTWSFSRVETFESCPYRWFLKYIKNYKDEDQFFATYGSFMHKLIERFYRGELTENQMLSAFLKDFKNEIRGYRPQPTVVENYINDGVNYLRSFTRFPFEMIAVEKEVKFEIEGFPFIGYIDFIGKSDEGIVIVDNKSRNLKPRSGRGKPTLKDKELDTMLRQLYIYSEAIKQEFGVLPSTLCFNCFRSSTLIQEPFNNEAFIESKNWAVQKIKEIEDAEEFDKSENYFSCKYICGVNRYCDRG